MPFSVSVLYLFCPLKRCVAPGTRIHGALVNGMVKLKSRVTQLLLRGEKS